MRLNKHGSSVSWNCCGFLKCVFGGGFVFYSCWFRLKCHRVLLMFEASRVNNWRYPFESVVNLTNLLRMVSFDFQPFFSPRWSVKFLVLLFLLFLLARK